MTRAVAIVHVYTDQVFDERDPSDVREIVGVLLQKADEKDADFDQRVSATKLRLTNITFRELFVGADPESLRLAASYLDDKAYGGYLETETVKILD